MLVCSNRTPYSSKLKQSIKRRNTVKMLQRENIVSMLAVYVGGVKKKKNCLDRLTNIKYLKVVGERKPRSESLQEQVLEWIFDMRSRGLKVSRKSIVLQKKALDWKVWE